MVARKVYKIGLDLGNILNKGTLIEDSGEVVLRRFANKITSEKTINPRAIKLERNGRVLHFGVGDLNNNSQKYDREYLEEQALIMINELLPNEEYVVVDLKVGLPPTQYFSDQAVELFKNKFTTGEEIECRINNNYKKIKINSITVYMEGYSAFKAVEAQGLLGDSKQRILGLDIGGGTTDICDYTFDYEDNCFYPNKPVTIPIGIVNITKAIANAINDNNADTVTQDQVEYTIKNNLELIENTYKIDDYKYSIDHLVNDMIRQIKEEYKIQSFETVQILGLGGGFNNFNKLTNNSISNNKNNIVVSDELKQFGNAIGYLCQ